MRKVAVVAALAAAFALAAVGLGTAALGDEGPDVPFSTIAGNPQNECAGGLKIDPVVDGTYNTTFVHAIFGPFAGTITIDVRSTPNGPVFDFVTDQASHRVTSVYVKGGPNAAFYSYASVGGGVNMDDGLHSPFNPNGKQPPGGKYYGLSHLCFFTDKVG